MFARTSKIASSRLTQLSTQFPNQVSRKASTMATLHTKQTLNTGAEIRVIPPSLAHQRCPANPIYSRRRLWDLAGC